MCAGIERQAIAGAISMVPSSPRPPSAATSLVLLLPPLTVSSLWNVAFR